MKSGWSDIFFSLAQLASLFCVPVASSKHAHLVCISVYVSTSKQRERKKDDFKFFFYYLLLLFYNKLITDSSHDFDVHIDTLIDARLYINFSL